ncbi:pantetheine-phosphate adenylyltransferase [Candidatus Venteria ishoeyi]|uniref:Phosphopantetheine adenylyltransferase n=1 Tax=Candidatus Venteria ishoeyi TaxID=1899563 RepID=A0A1H6F8I6_9GAMM|nr:pantetheine-phosphate adenylyltransferase [Candidatus Venteria ishoeyi]MDM8547262.1 pantetheine-phosphate adenylyltransferase [Candidatus Venteria ishoeyi]SEH06410.1 Phosphopantetheine adenylyltransferase [Candidatus Venteria ishoeyi]
MITKAIYPGTFDPVTYGHGDIIARAAKLFDNVTVAVATHPSKSPVFTQDERVELISQVFSHLDNVSACGFDCLLAEFAQQCHAQVIIRGLRAVSDFEYEFQLASMNRALMPHLETIFLPTSTKYTYISSSLVREVAQLGGEIEQFVDPIVIKALSTKINR